MLLTISTTHPPATDLGYLLYKHPDRVQTFVLPFGEAHIFYPEANHDLCTAALLLDINPLRLSRGSAAPRFPLEPYVNDRPYVASSFLSVALASVFGTALSGKCRERPELAQQSIPLEAQLVALPCRGGEPLLQQLFAPLGYQVESHSHPLDERFPEWGDSPYYAVTLRGQVRLQELLTHLYVLIPVLDDDKHYWVGEDEVEKLLRLGEGWLGSHPARDVIVHRYLKRQRSLTRSALTQLVAQEQPDPDALLETQGEEEETVERPLSLNQLRQDTVITTLKATGSRRVVDLGCAQGHLVRRMLKDPFFEGITAVDVSQRALTLLEERLERDHLSPRQRERLQIRQGSLIYRDHHWIGHDAATVIEVIEHLDPPRLSAFERVLFESTHPKVVILTTPNIEFNVRFSSLPSGKLRHRDHRFEWTRAEFRTWAETTANRFGYGVSFAEIGAVDPEVGAPTQMAVFRSDPG